MSPVFIKQPFSLSTGWLLLVALTLFRCGDGGLEPNPGDFPEIYGFQDLDRDDIYGAESGREIYVIGANFSKSDSQVFFGEKEAVIDLQHSTETEIRVLVPNFSTAQTVAVTVIAQGNQSDPAPFHVSVPRYYTVGAEPTSVIAEDLNGDDRPDLTVLHSKGLSILTGKGDGTFKAAREYLADQKPLAVRLGDLENDGALDLIVLNSNNSPAYPGHISILLGHSNETFQATAPFPAGNNPGALEIADLNKDGKLDLAVIHQENTEDYPGNISVFLGHGDGSWQGPVFFSTNAGRPHTLTIADLNKDSHDDLITLNRCISPDSPGTVSVLLGNGDGSFQEATQFTAGKEPLFLITEDLNRDGNLDLAVLNQGEHQKLQGNVSILLGKGDGSFQGTKQFPLSGYHSLGFKIEDLNNDGYLDLAVLNTWGTIDYLGNVSILLGKGDGTFLEAIHLSVAEGPTALAIEDINRDGIPDLAVTNNINSMYHGCVSIMFGQGDGSFHEAILFSSGTQPRALTLEDLNNDGLPDLTILNYQASNIHVLLGTEEGTFQASPAYNAGANPVSIKIDDLNGDRVNDLAVANEQGTISILFGDGDGTFQDPIEYDAGHKPKHLAINDLNNDNTPDLAVAGIQADSQGTVSILRGIGDGTFAQPEQYATGRNTSSVTVGDLNNDNYADLVTTNAGIHSRALLGNISILLGNGDGTFQAATQWEAGPHPNSAALADLNKDGNLDLTVVNHPSLLQEDHGSISIGFGRGDGTFKRPLPLPVTGFPYSGTMGDLNQDGRPDLVVTTWAESVSVFLGNRYGTFQRQEKIITNSVLPSLAIGDLDHDGHQDLAITNKLFGGNVSVLYGRGDGTFEKAVLYGVGLHPSSVAIADLDGIGPLDIATANKISNDVTVILNPER